MSKSLRFLVRMLKKSSYKKLLEELEFFPQRRMSKTKNQLSLRRKRKKMMKTNVRAQSPTAEMVGRPTGTIGSRR